MTSLKDIADQTGVSIRTVSRALKNQGYVDARVKARVHRVADSLGYRPNLAARRLRTGQSTEIGVILGSTDELHIAKLAAFEQTLREAGYGVFVNFLGPDRRRAIESLLDRQPAGCAMFPGWGESTEDSLVEFEQASLPTVLIDRPAPAHSPVASIRIDREIGVKEACRHLADTGRRRIAYLGPSSSNARNTGYRDVMADLGREPILIDTGDCSHLAQQERQGYQAVDAMLSLDPALDAIQVYSDVMAMGVLRRLHERGRSVPEDIAVIGFDDRSFASLATPPLSTVAQPNEDAGRSAARILLQRIQYQDPPPEGWNVCHSTRLVLRNST
jgi:LacI family transcriptional regulator